jgi:hypothetical protein
MSDPTDPTGPTAPIPGLAVWTQDQRIADRRFRLPHRLPSRGYLSRVLIESPPGMHASPTPAAERAAGDQGEREGGRRYCQGRRWVGSRSQRLGLFLRPGKQGPGRPRLRWRQVEGSLRAPYTAAAHVARSLRIAGARVATEVLRGPMLRYGRHGLNPRNMFHVEQAAARRVP